MDRYEQAALDAVNEARAELGAPPTPALAPGRRGRAGECAVAQSVAPAVPGASCTVNGGAIEVWRTDFAMPKLTIELGDDASEFVARFDGGLYPRYDLERVIEREGH
jgi:hypothetical protein